MYKRLGISTSASDADVRSAYRRQALATHPDKGGCAEAFRAVVEAFEILGDAGRRAAYDTNGGDRCSRSSHAEAFTRRSTAPTATAQASECATRTARFPRDGETPPPKRQRAPPPSAAGRSQAERKTQEGPDLGAASESAGCTASSGSGSAPTANSPEADARAEEDSATALADELLGLPRKTALARLEHVSETELHFFECCLKARVKLEEAKANKEKDSHEEDEKASSQNYQDGEYFVPILDADSGADAVALASPDVTSEMSEDIADAREEPERCLPICDAASIDRVKNHGQGRRNLRGICKNHGGFEADVGIENMQIFSQATSFDVAIDFHIELVNLRRQLRAGMDEGLDFPTVLRRAVHLLHQERKSSGAVPIRLSFRIKKVTKTTMFSKTTQDLEKAILVWQERLAEKSKQRLAAKQLRAEEERRRAAARQQRTEARRWNTEQRQQRAQERQQRAQERQQQAQERQRRVHERQQQQHRNSVMRSLRWLLARVQQQFCKVVRLRHQKRWGVPELPAGVELGTLYENDDCLCCVLRLRSGSLRRGPLRRSLAAAQKDLEELQALQRACSDAATLAELDRRDVEAMTAFFEQQLLK